MGERVRGGLSTQKKPVSVSEGKMQSGQSHRKLNSRYSARYVVRPNGRHDIDCTARFSPSKLSPYLLRPVSASYVYSKYSISYKLFTSPLMKWYIFC